jgi:hypothetical protein
VRGHHVSCFLSQVLGRRAQHCSIAAAFREHSPLTPLTARRSLAPPQLPYKKIPNCKSLSMPPAASFHSAPPPRRGITQRSRAPIALKRSREARAPACVCRAAVGPPEGGERRKTRRGAPAARRPGSCPARGSGGAQAGRGAQARAAAHLPRGDPARPAGPLSLWSPEPPRLNRPQLPARSHQEGLVGGLSQVI